MSMSTTAARRAGNAGRAMNSGMMSGIIARPSPGPLPPAPDELIGPRVGQVPLTALFQRVNWRNGPPQLGAPDWQDPPTETASLDEAPLQALFNAFNWNNRPEDVAALPARGAAVGGQARMFALTTATSGPRPGLERTVVSVIESFNWE